MGDVEHDLTYNLAQDVGDSGIDESEAESEDYLAVNGSEWAAADADYADGEIATGSEGGEEAEGGEPGLGAEVGSYSAEDVEADGG